LDIVEHIVVGKEMDIQIALALALELASSLEQASSLVVAYQHHSMIVVDIVHCIVVRRMVRNLLALVVEPSLVEFVDSIDVGMMVHSFVGKLGYIQPAFVEASSFVELASFLVVDSKMLDNQLGKIQVDIVVDKLVQLAIGRFVEVKLGL